MQVKKVVNALKRWLSLQSIAFGANRPLLLPAHVRFIRGSGRDGEAMGRRFVVSLGHRTRSEKSKMASDLTGLA